jgi:hypothetical protein
MTAGRGDLVELFLGEPTLGFVLELAGKRVVAARVVGTIAVPLQLCHRCVLSRRPRWRTSLACMHSGS